MDSGSLAVFAVVAASGSMNRAAEGLHTVQSNVTRQVRRLEAELGTELFHRHSRGVELTDAGHRLLPYAISLGNLLEDAERAVRDDGEPTGPLVIGSLETTAALRLPPVLAAFTRAYPRVDVTLVTDTTAGSVARVLAHGVQGAFVCGPIVHPDLDEQQIFTERLVIVTAPHVRSIHDVAADPDLRVVVFRVGCSYRQRLETYLASRGIAARRTLEFGTVGGILGCVAAGIGITLLPWSVVEPARLAGRVAVHELTSGESLVSTVFIRRQDRYVSSAVTQFLAVAQRHYADAT
ncbi:MAG: LysR family transcriptional regulator [Chloroflexi bacterium]|nr:LysR family transcriptional regulator [Chloroflexota bacterium]